MIDKSALAANLAEVKERIAAAAIAAGRRAKDITLIAVTKGHPAELISMLHELGVRDFGESYVAEALEKQTTQSHSADVEWHMIGHVQSRKAAEVASNFPWIHSVDSLKLASRLSKSAAEIGHQLSLLLEMNVSGEWSKHGFPAADDVTFDAQLSEIEQILQLPNVSVRGLMSMVPVSAEGEKARPYFERTRFLRDRLAERFDGDWKHLSMGMSGDYEAAILEGATMVRIGTAILGSRA